MDRTLLDKTLDTYASEQDKRDIWRRDMVVRCATVLAALLAALLALDSKGLGGVYQSLYLIPLLSSVTGILSAALVLHAYVKTSDRVLRELEKQICEGFPDAITTPEGRQLLLQKLPGSKLNATYEWIFYASFFVALISLLVYALFSRFFTIFVNSL